MYLNDDIGNQFRLIELLDRGSLKYPSSCVIDITKIIYDIFSKIDSRKQLFKNFYTGSSRTKLVQLACIRTETKYVIFGEFGVIVACHVGIYYRNYL